MLLSYVFAAQFAHAAPLAVALADEFPSKFATAADALPIALAAKAVETPWISAEELVAIMRHESGFAPNSAPRGHWNVNGPVPRRRHLICGLAQVTYEHAHKPPTDADRRATWNECKRGMTVWQSFADAVADRPGLQSLGRWARICRERYHVSDVTACAVSAHARGGRAGRAMESELWTYVQRVSKRLRAKVQRMRPGAAEVTS